MDERLRFVARLLEGELMTEVCREFGVSRKTGYKIFARYEHHGGEALCEALESTREATGITPSSNWSGSAVCQRPSAPTTAFLC